VGSTPSVGTIKIRSDRFIKQMQSEHDELIEKLQSARQSLGGLAALP
jgi:hypothetical protein